jgi:hypothetical protein
MRSPLEENTQLGTDPYANNYFQYVKDSAPPLALLPGADYVDKFMTSKRDDKGILCPLSAHVRKVNPRDTITEQGNSVDVLTRLVLRRGIPFGSACPGSLEHDDLTVRAEQDEERGLIFVSYQTSISEQFAFLQTTWANHPFNPNGAGGHDPIIGQGNRLIGEDRFLAVRAPGQPPQNITVRGDWVIATGGGFFFSPSISAIATVLGNDL